MPNRPIVRDSDIHEGRWHIDGTLVFITDLQADYRRAGQAIRKPYRAMGISDDEIDAALAFTFPPVLDAPEIDVGFISLTVHCVCGVKRHAYAAGPGLVTDVCSCGRTWRLPVGIEPGPTATISGSAVGG